MEHDNTIIEQALEILESRLQTPDHYFTSPNDVKSYLTLQFADAVSESFRVLFLDSQHGLIACKELFKGTIDGAAVYPREVVRTAIELNAAAVILSHNHPSGVCEPSTADRHITKRITDALQLIDVRVLDHVVVGGADTVSFAERGWA